MVRIGLPHRLKSQAGSSKPNSRNASPARPNGLVLKISVLKGRNLAPKDKSGTSDPYLVVTLGENRQSTPSISKTLNPEWLVNFEMPISGPRNLLLEAVCWDKDRFGKDYMGEFDLVVEDLFAHGKTTTEPQWFTLKSSRSESKKKSVVSGEIQLQFVLTDPSNPNAKEADILSRLKYIAAPSPSEEKDDDLALAELDSRDDDDVDEISDETENLTQQEIVEKQKKRLRIKRLKKKAKAQAYEFSGGSDVVGILFLEIGKISDLPPERNVTRTSFDMDPFVVASLGRKTYRTRIIRHNLNPIYNEKMLFQVLQHEQQYSINFAVVDRDKLSGNDFVGTVDFPISSVIEAAPEPDPKTNLYPVHEKPEPSIPVTPAAQKSRFRLPLSRSSSATSLKNASKPPLSPHVSSSNLKTEVGTSTSTLPVPTESNSLLTPTSSNTSTTSTSNETKTGAGHVSEPDEPPPAPTDDPDMKEYVLPLNLKRAEKWSDKHPTQVFIKAKYLPYPALRQQFWRSMLKQYDADDTRTIGRVELTTMLDTLGSTLKEATIDRFFNKFSNDGHPLPELTIDQAVICLEEQLMKSQSKSVGQTVKGFLQSPEPIKQLFGIKTSQETPNIAAKLNDGPDNDDPNATTVPSISQAHTGAQGEQGDFLSTDDLGDDRDEEHVIEIQECPICHQPRLDKRSDADIITHLATCMSSDWRGVNQIVMGGFVTSSQAQRKWYSKVITKISYGGYKLGANSANILVQDRLTGQINEERMSVYVRLGIRLLYKGLKSREMETKKIRNLLKSLSIKQGKKYDDPASAAEIPGFINFHKLDMSEVLLPIEKFKNFNEFFYRALKPTARPVSAPNEPKVIVSPADCRTVVFNKMDDATRIWVKGREFSIARLLGDAYPEDAKRYVNGSLGIFRLAPQDYHRFHVPVDGVMDTPKLIAGEYYTVNPMAIRSALDVYGENIRVIVPIDSVAHGRVMAICVGAMMVGSTVITRKPGEHLKRGEELGYFKFGGSTVLLLFEPGVMRFDQDLVDNANDAVETLVRVGMSIGHSPDVSQHLPDTKKSEKEISLEDKQDAKRRIAGSLAPAKPDT